jgi:hypothetical protein
LANAKCGVRPILNAWIIYLCLSEPKITTAENVEYVLKCIRESGNSEIHDISTTSVTNLVKSCLNDTPIPLLVLPPTTVPLLGTSNTPTIF